MNDHVWVLSDGRTGIENQALGLAEAIGAPFAIKRIQAKGWQTLLPGHRWPNPMAALADGSDDLTEPWPRLLIACGRIAIPYALHIREMSQGRTFVVYLQDPRIDPAYFDLVVAPYHDRVEGPNVIKQLGSLNRITAERLKEEAEKWKDRFAALPRPLPRPLVAVLIGGSNSRYEMSEKATSDLIAGLQTMHDQTGCGFLVTASRRTGAANEALLQSGLKDLPCFYWDGTGDNPYFAFLGSADAFVVTGDSVNMATEAARTGKPIYILPLPRKSGLLGLKKLAPDKFAAFHQDLQQIGITKVFDGSLESWSYTPLDNAKEIADVIRQRLPDLEQLGEST